jgi:hypothetical protein
MMLAVEAFYRARNTRPSGTRAAGGGHPELFPVVGEKSDGGSGGARTRIGLSNVLSVQVRGTVRGPIRGMVELGPVLLFTAKRRIQMVEGRAPIRLLCNHYV